MLVIEKDGVCKGQAEYCERLLNKEESRGPLITAVGRERRIYVLGELN